MLLYGIKITIYDTTMKMFQKNTVKMYLLFFAFLFNSCTANKVADSLIQKSCKKITKFLDKDSDSNFLKDCVASLRENPESEKYR
ncbi:unnamed protein product [Brassica oleracea]